MHAVQVCSRSESARTRSDRGAAESTALNCFPIPDNGPATKCIDRPQAKQDR
jgi:hypothetical protein